MCIYLTEYLLYSKIHSSYILLFIQNKKQFRLLLLQIKVQSSSSSIILLQSHPIYSSFIRIIRNFRSEILVLTKNPSCCFFFSFISCCAGAYAGDGGGGDGGGGGGGAVGVVEVTRFFYRIIQSLRLYWQPDFSDIYEGSKNSSSDLYRTACETTSNTNIGNTLPTYKQKNK